MIASPSQLLSETRATLLARWMLVCAVMATGTFLLFAVRSLYLWKLENYRLQYVEGVGVTMQRNHIADLQRRRAQGDSAAEAELKQINDTMSKRLQAMRGANTHTLARPPSESFAAVMGPPLLIYTVTSTLVLLSSFLAFFLLSLEPLEPADLLQRMKKNFLPFVLLLLRIFFFSFLWVPLFAILTVRMAPGALLDNIGLVQITAIFLGYFCVIVLAPRYFLAPLLLIGENRNATESQHESYEKTHGYWGKVLWNLLLLFAALAIVGFSVLSMVRALLSDANPLPFALARSLFLESGLALWTVYFVRLSLTVRANPMRKEDYVELLGDPVVLAGA